MNLTFWVFSLQEPIFVPDPVISLAVEPNNKVKTELKYQIVAKELGVLLFSLKFLSLKHGARIVKIPD